MVHACTKSLNETKKKFAPEFPILSAIKLPSCGLVIFIVTCCTYIHITEGRNVKIFWKENYAIALDSCNSWTIYLKNAEHGTENDVDGSTYGVFMH